MKASLRYLLVRTFGLNSVSSMIGFCCIRSVGVLLPLMAFQLAAPNANAQAGHTVADTVTIVQIKDDPNGQSKVSQTMSVEEYERVWNRGMPMTFVDENTKDAFESIVPTPDPPVHIDPFLNGDQLNYTRSGSLDNFTYTRRTTYTFVGGPGGAGSPGDPWGMTNNAVTVAPPSAE